MYCAFACLMCMEEGAEVNFERREDGLLLSLEEGTCIAWTKCKDNAIYCWRKGPYCTDEVLRQCYDIDNSPLQTIMNKYACVIHLYVWHIYVCVCILGVYWMYYRI